MKYKFFITDKYIGYKLDEVKLEAKNISSNIYVNPNVTYQKFIGFGGAFTEASAYNLKRVSSKVKEEALTAYFDKNEGIGYTLGRMSMGSCDFSLLPYDYIKENDYSLSTFDISREDELVIPLYNDACKVAGEKIKLMISPWSPSAWMKDNNSRIRGGHLKKECYDVWSSYFIKFLTELNKREVSVFSVSVQNEPAAVQRWDSCIYSPEDEGLFAKKYLGPKLNKFDKDIKLFVWDHNRDIMIDRVKPIYNGDDDLVYGTAIHWYDNEPYENILKHHELFPNKHIIHTEGCIESGPHFDNFECGERYARNIFGDLNNYVEAFIDWNLFLDETGGPNWVNNLCDAPIMIRVNWDCLVKQYSYYFIGHFSKFIRPNALRISSTTNNELLNVTSFINEDGSIATVVSNPTETDFGLKLKIKEDEVSFLLPKRSIITIVGEDDE